MYKLTNKVTGAVQQGEMEGSEIVLADGSRIPVTTGIDGLLSSKMYLIEEVVEVKTSPETVTSTDSADNSSDEDIVVADGIGGEESPVVTDEDESLGDN